MLQFGDRWRCFGAPRWTSAVASLRWIDLAQKLKMGRGAVYSMLIFAVSLNLSQGRGLL
jgi:hypothetical protein